MRGAKIAQKQVRKASVPAAYFDLFQTITVSLLAPQRELGQEKGREGREGWDWEHLSVIHVSNGSLILSPRAAPTSAVSGMSLLAVCMPLGAVAQLPPGLAKRVVGWLHGCQNSHMLSILFFLLLPSFPCCLMSGRLSSQKLGTQGQLPFWHDTLKMPCI